MTSTASPRRFEIGVDIGGTFTDIVCREFGGGRMHVLKVPTSRGDPSAAVIQAIVELRERWGVGAAEVSRFAHGTTVATNAVLERKGARIGLLTTAGFRDVLEIGRQLRTEVYRIVLDPEAPVFLAPRRYRREIAERIDAQGVVLMPLDEAAVVGTADELVAEGVEAIAIAFLFSFRNPAHERRAAELIRARHPRLMLSLSHEVDPAFREYERTVVTAFDAYLKPRVDTYLARLEEGLAQAGIAAPLQVMQSRGGLASAQVARQRPVRLFLSGPAAGVIGGQMVGASADAGRPDHDRRRRHVGRHRADQPAQADAALRRRDRRLRRARGHGRRDHDRLGRRQQALVLALWSGRLVPYRGSVGDR